MERFTLWIVSRDARWAAFALGAEGQAFTWLSVRCASASRSRSSAQKFQNARGVHCMC